MRGAMAGAAVIRERLFFPPPVNSLFGFKVDFPLKNCRIKKRSGRYIKSDGTESRTEFFKCYVYLW